MLIRNFKKDILAKIVLRAMKNGWTANGLIRSKNDLSTEILDDIVYFLEHSHPLFYFELDFARAFWGGHYMTKTGYMNLCTKCRILLSPGAEKNPANECSYWAKKLQKLVLENDRIKFLSKYV